MTATPLRDTPITRASARPRRLRSDIQGIRAIAVVAVLVYHLWPTRLPGGFVGVDVFFVVSGFLITGHLVRELRKTGRIRLWRFWAKRAKRLLPAATLVLFVSAVATLIWAPLSLRSQFLWEHVASALNIENWILAWNSVDYLAARNTASPVQHYWTLSVEEQFYIVLPLLILGAVLLSRRPRIDPARVVLILLALIGVTGFIYSLALTSASPSVAYFSTATRSWEFAAGALLSFINVSPGRVFRWVLTLGGSAALLASITLLSGSTPFPGFAAMLPVLGTVALIAAGPSSPFATVSSVPGVGFLGRVSYSLYLWHWPLIVLVPLVLGQGIGTPAKLAVAAVSILLAWATVTLVEDPIRFSPRLLGGSRTPRTVALWCGSAIVIVVLVAAVGINRSDARSADAAALTASAAEQAAACFGAAAMDPELGPCEAPAPDAVLVPDPSVAAQDDYNRTECWSKVGVEALAVCSVGPDTGYDKRVFAVGDSHNNALLIAYEQVAKLNNWRIDVAGHNSCYWSARAHDDSVDEYETACSAWKSNVTAYLNDNDPYDAIFATNSTNSWPTVQLPGETQESATVAGLTEVWSQQAARGTTIVGIRDNAGAREDVVQCVERERSDANAKCAQSRAAAFTRFDAITPAVAATPGAALIDLTRYTCTSDECLVVVGGVVVYRDQDHLTATFARTLGPYLARDAAAVLKDRTGP